jgi:hypothetical protein
MMTYRFFDLTLADLGWRTTTDDPNEQEFLQRRARGFMDAADRLLVRAGQESDLCGLALTNLTPMWTGGYTYLHRDVPFFPISSRVLAEGPLTGANYAIAGASMTPAPNLTLVASEEDLKLYRRDGECGPPPPDYSRHFAQD